MTRYYLGVAVEIDVPPPHVGYGSNHGRTVLDEDWVWATWPDGRRFLHWRDQLKGTPWGE